jgi:hypothetical protein
MMKAVPGNPFKFTAPTGEDVTIVSLSRKAGPNVPAFRYAAQPLEVITVNVGDGKTLPGATLTVAKGRRVLRAMAPFATEPPKGEFFFQEVIVNGQNISLVLLGSVLPDEPTIAWTIEGE